MIDLRDLLHRRQGLHEAANISAYQGFLNLQADLLALVGMVQWAEYWPVNRNVIGSVPNQGTCLVCGPGSQLGVSFSLSSPLSKK